MIDPIKEGELPQRERFQLDDPNWTPVIRDCLEELCEHDYDDDELEHIAVLLHRAHHAGFMDGESRARDEVNKFFANTLTVVSDKTERERTARCYVTETPGLCPECGAYLTEK